MLLLVAFAVAPACSDLGEIEKRVDNLESKVTALETQISALNDNITALKEFAGGATINSIKEADGVYTITLSNGQTLTLTQGSVGSAVAPKLSIDAEGYWMADYSDGRGSVYITDQNGGKIKATGQAGVTPVFGVDADGYWTVDYGDGPQRVKDAMGGDVSALSQTAADSGFFKNVVVGDDTLTLTLSNGETVVVPIIPDFLCAIKDVLSAQVFESGESKTYTMELKGVASTVVLAPEGWNAVLEGTTLTVTAPVLTKAVLADTRSDVSVLAVSAGGFSTIAKMQVSVVSGTVVVTPAATVVAGDVSQSTLTFTVTLTDVTSWKYLLSKATDPAPDRDKLTSDGTTGSETTLTLSGLDASTEYILYVLPINGSVLGEIASARATTSAPVYASLYDQYMAGENIEIAGVTYNKATNGDPIELTASAAKTDLRASIHQKEGVFFLSAADGATFDIPSVTEITKDVVLISKDASHPVTIEPTVCTKCKSGSLVMKDLIIDMTHINGASNAGYFLNNANATSDFGALHFEDCRFVNVQKPILYMNVLDKAVKSIIVNRCDIVITGTPNQLFNIYNNKVLDHFEALVFDNNIVCSSAVAPVSVFSYGQATAQSGTTWNAEASVSNNIFYNTPAPNGYFKFYMVKTLNFNNNVMSAPATATNGSNCYGLFATSGNPTINFEGNIAYGMVEGKNWAIAVSSTTFKPEPNTLTKLTESPFASEDIATCTFTLKPEYSSCGPVR